MTQTHDPSPPHSQSQESADGEGQFATASRTHTWVRPGQLDPSVLLAMDGYDQLLAITQGQLPTAPIGSTLGLESFEVERGRVAVQLRAAEFHYNPLGGVHGGVLSTLLDTAAGCAVHSTLAAGELYTSLDLTVKFLRPVTVDSGLLRAEGTVLQRGRRTALAEAKLYDEAGKLAAYASSTCMIFSAQEGSD